MTINDPNQVNALYQFGAEYLERRGWFESLDGIPRNKDGVVPWITYPAFRQLQRIVRPTWQVFEYGCGGSSLWWARKALRVTSVEHDAGWAQQVAQAAPQNLTIISRAAGAPCDPARQEMTRDFFAAPPHQPLSRDRAHNVQHGLVNEDFVAYATEICAFAKQSLDVVVVDGMARSLTAWLAAQYVRPDGVIVFDNADRWQYNGAFQFLHAAGFRRLDFYGPGPVNRQEWCTALFVRDLSIFVGNINSPNAENDLGW